jgi:hypothetical protein
MYKRTMVISADDKKILLARLEKARETKAAKAAAKKKETLADVKEPEPPAPAPVVAPPPVPEPAPIVPPPPSEPIDIPAVPDLVAASKRKPAKKKRVESSDEDSDDEPVLPPKKGAKKQAYMKIKIYKEPKNAAAFQSLIEAVQDEQPEEPEPEPAPVPASASIGRSCRFANANANNMAMKKGTGVISAQELMRRAAMEFFS